MLDLSERDLRLGEEIIGNVEDDGRLSCSLEDVVGGVNAWLAELREMALSRAQELNPEELAEEVREIEEEFRSHTLDEAEGMLTRVQPVRSSRGGRTRPTGVYPAPDAAPWVG